MKASAAPPNTTSVGRQPMTRSPAGTARPASVTITYTPDCLTPVTTPRTPCSTWRAISLLVTGFENACDTPPIAAPRAKSAKTLDAA